MYKLTTTLKTFLILICFTFCSYTAPKKRCRTAQQSQKSSTKKSSLKSTHKKDLSSTITNEADTKTTASTQKKESASQTRTIQVVNDISNKELGYKYILGTFHPLFFTLTVNGSVIKQGTETAITITKNNVEISYACEFENGRKSSKKYLYKLAPTTKKVRIQFRWKKDPRITLDDPMASLESEVDLT